MSWFVDPFKFWMILARLGGFVLIAPGLKEVPAPTPFKALCLGWLAFMLMPIVPDFAGPTPEITGLLTGVAGEVGIGLMMGLVPRLIMSSIQMGGALLDNETGFLSAQQFGAAIIEGDGIFGRWTVWIALFYFWIFDYFSLLIVGLGRSFTTLPLHAFQLGTESLAQIIRLSAAIFTGGLIIAAPMMALMFFVTLGFGLTARAIQGIPIFMENFTVRILVGLGAMLVGLPLILLLVRSQLQVMIPALSRCAALAGGGGAP